MRVGPCGLGDLDRIGVQACARRAVGCAAGQLQARPGPPSLDRAQLLPRRHVDAELLARLAPRRLDWRLRAARPPPPEPPRRAGATGGAGPNDAAGAVAPHAPP